MRLLALSLVIALLIGCNQQKPKFSDAQIRAIRISDPGMTDACIEKLRSGGVDAMPEHADQCYKFEKPRRWKGIWFNQFEGLLFCPDPVERTCPKNAPTYENEIWLEFSSKPPVELGRGGVYEIEFIGRRSLGAGHFGHMGMSPNDMIVDRMISTKELEAPPKD